MTHRYDAATLQSFAKDLFIAAGLDTTLAAPVACYLVEADLMGHDTHGLALAPGYLAQIADGTVRRTGAPQTISDKGAAVCWRGHRLPGAALVVQAIDLAIARAEAFGTCTVAVGDAHHIGALAAYLHRATDRGMMVSLASSAPSAAHMAPLGGTTGVLTPNPVAYGIPTPDGPILIDISASITTYNMAQRLIREGRHYPAPWLLTADGIPTTDPAALSQGGTLLPAGGMDHGQKGYGMALQVEALTQGLSGHGRADAPKGTTNAFTVQVWDPEAFGGADAFLRQTGWLANACHASPAQDRSRPVRLPGQAALARKARALSEGVVLYPSILPSLTDHAVRLDVALPAPL